MTDLILSSQFSYQILLYTSLQSGIEFLHNKIGFNIWKNQLNKEK
ncbi:unnamed protein product [Tenebrio molitor]|nr:unnamed protein product [Tenebrio molitor]